MKLSTLLYLGLLLYITAGAEALKSLEIPEILETLDMFQNGIMLSASLKVSRVSSVYKVSTVSELVLIYMSRSSLNNDEPYKCFKALRVYWA